MNKKIIFIGGTARSGSTLLDLILANDPNAMSLGEINALFTPTRKHHFEELKKLKEDSVWSKIIAGGKQNLYPNLIKYFPNIEIFVDSSKDPLWFHFHAKRKRPNCDIKHVLIYKSPEELAKSYIKRGNPKGWYKTYMHYHKQYFSLIKNFRTIAYKDLISEEEGLIKLCEDLGIEYFDRKKNYWEKKQNTFFGSNTVKMQNSDKAKSQIQNYGRADLTYDKPDDEILDAAKEQVNEHEDIVNIFNVLKVRYVDKRNLKLPQYSPIFLFILKQIKVFKQLYRYYKPENYFNT